MPDACFIPYRLSAHLLTTSEKPQPIEPPPTTPFAVLPNEIVRRKARRPKKFGINSARTKRVFSALAEFPKESQDFGILARIQLGKLHSSNYLEDRSTHGQKLLHEKRLEIASRLFEALRSLYQDRVVMLSDTRAQRLAEDHPDIQSSERKIN